MSNSRILTLKELLAELNVSTSRFCQLYSDSGYKVSKPTIYRWTEDPKIMNGYDQEATAKALGIPLARFLAILHGFPVDIKVESTIIFNK